MNQLKYSSRVAAILLLLLVAVHLASSQRITSTGHRKVIRSATVSYPKMALQLGLQGTVKVLATVAPGGKVVHTELIGGSPIFVPYALDAVVLMRWEPAPKETKEFVEVDFLPGKRNGK